MAVTIGTWTTDPNGQQWYYSVTGWGKIEGVSGGTPVEWSTISDADRPTISGQVVETAATVTETNTNAQRTILSGPVGGKTGAESGTLRWPKDVKHDTSDYVLFQFGKYVPPFSRDINKVADGGVGRDGTTIESNDQADTIAQGVRDHYINSNGYGLYNHENLDIDDPEVSDLNNIILPIPQDLSNELQAVWQGKQFTTGGRAAIAGLAGGQFHYATRMVENITGHMKAAQTAINTAVLNAIPGVGGNIDFNDVSGSTQGIVINPNAELMYDSPEMREVGMVFKMVPRNKNESNIIRDIYQTFRKASLPSFGGAGGARRMFTSNEDGTGGTTDIGDQDDINMVTEDNNWIRVPALCKFTFMKGGTKHPHLIQFKPCAISKVEVNYTADGTYATYSDGAPLSVELTLNFMETKVIFKQDVGKGF